MRLHRAILYRHEKIFSEAGMIAGSAPRKLYMSVGRFVTDTFGLMYEFGLAFCLWYCNQLFQWIAAGSSGTSMQERLGGTKISPHDEMLMFCLC